MELDHTTTEFQFVSVEMANSRARTDKAMIRTRILNAVINMIWVFSLIRQAINNPLL